MIDKLVNNVDVRGILLDRSGSVVQLSALDVGGPLRDDPLFGLKPGESYLGSCTCPDPQFIEVRRGVKDLLERKIDFFSTLYWSQATGMTNWYILAAFPRAYKDSQIVVLLIDISGGLKASAGLSAMMIGRGAAASGQVESIITNTIRRAISDTFAHSRDAASARSESKDHPDRVRLAKLSKTQHELVGLLANGLSNAEIAERRNVTVNTVKTQVADVIHKLGFSNRTQVALFAARNHCVAS
jgi:DNA-binding NarL/FixJ family response regulator